MALQSSTETSRNCILHEEVQGILQILLHTHPHTIRKTLHPESNSTYRTPATEGQRALHPVQKSNSTCRRQRDLQVHPFILQDLPKAFQAFQPQDLPKAFQRFQIFQTFQSFMTSSLSRQYFMFLYLPVPPGFSPHYGILQLECIFYIFYTSTGFHKKLHRVPVETLQTLLQTFILQRKGDVAIWVMSETSDIADMPKGRNAIFVRDVRDRHYQDVKLTFTSK